MVLLFNYLGMKDSSKMNFHHTISLPVAIHRTHFQFHVIYNCTDFFYC